VSDDPERLTAEGTGRPIAVIGPVLLLAFMAFLGGGAALRESATIDEVAHIGAGLSYWQTLDMRMNEEHPPLPKLLAALPLVLRGTHADYSSPAWRESRRCFSALVGEWVFGDWVVTQWNEAAKVLAWARVPMLALTLALGGVLLLYARRLAATVGGLLCLSVYASAPVFLAFGPLALTDIALTLFALVTVWQFADTWRMAAEFQKAQSGRTYWRYGLSCGW
jgi:dolichyl-phosphate-mannose--protein O-mannosyl transferase